MLYKRAHFSRFQFATGTTLRMSYFNYNNGLSITRQPDTVSVFGRCHINYALKMSLILVRNQNKNGTGDST